MIRVLVVDDSLIIRTVLKRILNKDPRIEVVGEADSGEDAILKNRLLKPDAITMDIYMPGMNGIEATKRIMQEHPAAIMIFSTEDSAYMGYSALEAGALDMVKKPSPLNTPADFYREFIDRLIAVTEKFRSRKTESASVVLPEAKKGKWKTLLIGASTGGPVAVQKVLTGLGKGFPMPILVTQHIDKAFDGHYAKWLSETTGQTVILPKNKEVLKPGVVYVAPAGYHMEIGGVDAQENVFVKLTDTPPVNFVKPAVDCLFQSAAKFIGSGCIAILLTGMGKDGANGCSQICQNGGFTIVESEETCVVFGMPKAAIEMGGASSVLPIQGIAPYVRRMTGK